jgi:hypothetical protein
VLVEPPDPPEPPLPPVVAPPPPCPLVLEPLPLFVVPEALAWRDAAPPAVDAVVDGGSELLGGSEVVGGLVVGGGLVVLVGGLVVFVVGGAVLEVVVLSCRFGAVVAGRVAGAWARVDGGTVTLVLDRVVEVPVVRGGTVDLETVVFVGVASAVCLGEVNKPTTLPPIAPISTAKRMLTHFRAATYRTGLTRRTPPVRAS